MQLRLSQLKQTVTKAARRFYSAGFGFFAYCRLFFPTLSLVRYVPQINNTKHCLDQVRAIEGINLLLVCVWGVASRSADLPAIVTWGQGVTTMRVEAEQRGSHDATLASEGDSHAPI